MPRTTPLHPRTSALNHSFLWKEWGGYAAVRTFDAHTEQEYHAIRHTAGLMDVTPLCKYDVSGKDAARLLSRVWTRDITKLKGGQVVYSAMADGDGQCLDDGTIQKIGPDLYRMSSSERWLHWLARHGRGLDVQVVDMTDRLTVMAVQGPLARRILDAVVDYDLATLRFFRVRKTTLAGKPVRVSRTGFTGDLGYEVWCSNADALAVWDAIMEEGRPLGMRAHGLDALDVARIEAGFVIQGVDYVSARRCLIEERKSTPDEAGLGWTVDLERDPFVGQAAIAAERAAGSEWAFVGVVFDWAALDALYEEYGLPPHLAPVACRDAVPIYAPGSDRQVGQITSTTWSPILKKYIALGQVHARYGAEGTPLSIEHTVEFHRRRCPATVVPKPFYDPPHKRHTPGGAR